MDKPKRGRKVVGKIARIIFVFIMLVQGGWQSEDVGNFFRYLVIDLFITWENIMRECFNSFDCFMIYKLKKNYYPLISKILVTSSIPISQIMTDYLIGRLLGQKSIKQFFIIS